MKSPPLILPLDFISPSLPLSDFLLNYHSNSLPNTPLLQTLFYELGSGEGVSKEREKEVDGDGSKRSLVGYDLIDSSSTYSSSQKSTSNSTQTSISIPKVSTSSHNLRFIIPLSNYDTSSELILKASLLNKSQKLRISKNLIDSHIYILDLKKVLNLLESHEEITSLREHLIPFLVKCSWQIGLKEKVGWNPIPTLSSSSNNGIQTRRSSTIGMGDTFPDDQIEMGEEIENRVDYRKVSARKAGMKNGIGRGKEEGMEELKCLSIIVRLRDERYMVRGEKDEDSSEKEGFVIRVNTLPAWLEASRHVSMVFVLIAEIFQSVDLHLNESKKMWLFASLEFWKADLNHLPPFLSQTSFSSSQNSPKRFSNSFPPNI